MTNLIDLAPVDVSLAQEEIKGRTDGSWLRLSPLAQNQLIASYQQGRIAEAQLKDVKDRALFKKLSAMRSQGRDHAGLLVDSCFGLVWGKLRSEAVMRMGENWANQSSDDLKAEAHAFILEKAAGYNPEVNSSFNAYLASQVTYLVSETFKDAGRSGTMSDSWKRTLRQVVAILKEGRELGREVSRDELIKTLEARAHVWAERDLDLASSELSEEERAELRRKKLSKQGTLSALKDIDHLIALAAGEVRLDASLGTDSSTTYAEMHAGTVDVESQVLGDSDPEAALKRVYQVALGDQSGDLHSLMVAYHGLLGAVEGEAAVTTKDEEGDLKRNQAWTLNRISAHSGIERVQVRNVLKDRARARLASPHAQFAHLAFEVEVQFEVEVKDTLSEVRAMPRELFADF